MIQILWKSVWEGAKSKLGIWYCPLTSPKHYLNIYYSPCTLIFFPVHFSGRILFELDQYTYVNLTCSNSENYSMAAPNPSKQILEVAKLLQQHWKPSLKNVLKIYKMTIIFLIKSQRSVSNMWVITCKWNWEMTSFLVTESQIWRWQKHDLLLTHMQWDSSFTTPCLSLGGSSPAVLLKLLLQLPPPDAFGFPTSNYYLRREENYLSHWKFLLVRKHKHPLWFFLFAACWRWKLLTEIREVCPDPAYQ